MWDGMGCYLWHVYLSSMMDGKEMRIVHSNGMCDDTVYCACVVHKMRLSGEQRLRIHEKGVSSLNTVYIPTIPSGRSDWLATYSLPPLDHDDVVSFSRLDFAYLGTCGCWARFSFLSWGDWGGQGKW